MPSRLGVPIQALQNGCAGSQEGFLVPESAHSGLECVLFWPENVHFWFFRAKWSTGEDDFNVIGVSGLWS